MKHIILNTQQMIDWANGKEFYNTSSGTSGTGYGFSQATYQGETDAFNAIMNAGWTLTWIAGFGDGKEYYFSK